jgi:hypothetical protein
MHRETSQTSVCQPRYRPHAPIPFIQDWAFQSRWACCCDASLPQKPSHKWHQYSTGTPLCHSCVRREEDTKETHRLWEDETWTVNDSKVGPWIALHVHHWRLMQKPLRPSLVHVQPWGNFCPVCALLGHAWRCIQGSTFIPISSG